jgi:hypothetical protein
VLQPPEQQNKQADRAFPAHVVSHLDEGKGWIFWVPSTDKLVCSAWANFEEMPGVPMIKLEHLTDKPKTVPTTYPSSNLLFLGDFSHEIAFEQEERLVDDFIRNCGFYSVGIPKTYKQALKLPDWDKWKLAVEEELSNLDRKQVWEVEILDSPKKELESQWVFSIKTVTRYKALLKKKVLISKRRLPQPQNLCP